MRVAIIGSGIAGLAAAHHLRREHDITVFEANDYIGGHTNTIRFQHGGRDVAIDTGFIVFNSTHYPHFTRLLSELEVPSRPTNMSFSVRSDANNLEYNGDSLATLFAQKANILRPRFHRMLLDILRFNREAPRHLESGDTTLTVQQFVERNRYSRSFTENYLVPLGAALWSSPASRFRTFPIHFVIGFLANHNMLQVTNRPQWRVVEGGSYRYVEKLVAPFRHRIRLNTPVARVCRLPRGVEVVTATGEKEDFDRAILACHADQALGMVENPTDLEQDLLGAFPYQPNEAILHTDTRVLPQRRRAWASWNYRVGAGSEDRVSVTYNMNLLQGLEGPDTFLVTLNDDTHIAPERILRRIHYTHPVFGSGWAEAQARHGELVDHNRLSYCGAYWGYGFHEDGVRSALRVCDSFQVRAAA